MPRDLVGDLDFYKRGFANLYWCSNYWYRWTSCRLWEN